MFDDFGINAGFVEDLHAQYRQSPQLVEEHWRSYFASLERGEAPPSPVAPAPATNGANGNGALSHAAFKAPGIAPSPALHVNGAAPGVGARDDRLATAALSGRVYQLVNAYRVRGHLFAKIDPLGTPPEAAPELELSNFGLTEADYDVEFPTVGIGGLPGRATLREIIAHLSETYCGSIGVEFTHIEEPDAREWLQNAMESTRNRAQLDNAELVRILKHLTDAEIFEQFVHKNFVGAKRFSCEGAESMIAMLDLLIDYAAGHGVEEIVIGMAHRGRLNVLANIMNKNVREIFAAFRDSNPERNLGRGDVKYHLGESMDRPTTSGGTVHLSLAFNPSHLEFVNPVVEGRVRAKQDRRKRLGVMPLLIHGDAAFMGQGVIPETLNLAGLEGYSTGGTVHLVVNNQIGFTTLPQDSRSTRYCTDITRMLKVPVFHVNGEDPEAVIQTARLATEFRQRFGKDVVIDMLCYRRYGHNEGDEPRFTQPLMYKLIDQKPTVREVYVKKLVESGQITQEQGDQLKANRQAALAQALEEEKKGDYLKPPKAMEGVWTPYVGGADKNVEEVDTSVSREILGDLATRLAELPPGFNANPKVKAVLDTRRERVLKDQPFDWGTGEHLAFASLVNEGRMIRITGQDARRGTFTHRHATLFDAQTGARHTPLANLGKGVFEVHDSPLSEAGVLGFEYGYSLDRPDALVIWEAQFGDFANGAQVIIDQFIVSAEDKWLRLSGLVLLLPHGYEGQGPEHSSARIERFLQLSASDNIQVCNLTTPAQLFHALRRQVLRPWRKPLVIFTPKSLLRHKEAVSTTTDLAEGKFHRVIADSETDPSKVKRVLLCTGKVYYDLVDARRKLGRDDVAIVRLEQLYPINDELSRVLSAYADGTRLVWVQEEPRNMGPWYFMNANLLRIIGERLPLSVVSRPAAASPATGSKASHDLEQQRLLAEALAR
ncbi:MAG: 2-oxoglutarate dehydrogenase E1 component [Labilithrix sp.]|nr:2-oxoglutarate dehydrogenase E1 component [Labilithrix sp.]MCW5835109.1 2-oxoglutarate dehydrogenase E1 component [Labilithrix sp.]